MSKPTKEQYLKEEIKHVDISAINTTGLVDAMRQMSFSARDLARACDIFEMMLKDKDCTTVLTLAGSTSAGGCMQLYADMIKYNMIDVVVSTGASVDFFEALGFRHYIGDPKADDDVLQKQAVDRIYDTYISEHELRVCDATVSLVADRLPPKPHSSREFTAALGAFLHEQNLGQGSLLRTCYEKGVPVFVPSLSDCSAGFGLTFHQMHHPDAHLTHDSVRDFSELTRIVSDAKASGMLIIGGGVPKNFTADTVVCAEVLGKPIRMHKYAIQITVADERDGALSGSTLKEAHSWGKVDLGAEQMIFSEATLSLPLMVSYAYHKGHWKNRSEKRLSRIFAPVQLLPEPRGSAGMQEVAKARKELTSAVASR